MKAIILFAFALLHLTSLVESSCPDGWVHHRNKCYHFSHDAETMPVAALMCKHMDGTLIEIESYAENIYLTSQVKLYRQNFWIGLNDMQNEGNWIWYETKRSVNTTNVIDWAQNQPDNGNTKGAENCVVLSRDGHWADYQCRNIEHYICQKLDAVVSIVG